MTIGMMYKINARWKPGTILEVSFSDEYTDGIKVDVHTAMVKYGERIVLAFMDDGIILEGRRWKLWQTY